MKTRGLLFCLLVLALMPLPVLGQERPNVLVILADDLGVDALGMYGIGTDQPHTPNLDALADEGILFENAWAYPTCSPTRAAMLSGLYGSKTGVLAVPGILDLRFTTLFEQTDAITSNTYAIASIGKWHIGGNNDLTNPNDQGADHFVGWTGGAVNDYFDWERIEDGTESRSTDYLTSHLTDEAIAWIDEQTTPWLLWLAHGTPHTPFHLPPDSLYTRTKTSSNLDQYMAMIESMDHEIGRLLDSMSQAERDNTLIIFVGDNGTPRSVLQGFPAGRGKDTLYQGGLRVPMIAAGAGVTRIHASETALVHVLDVYATIMEVMGTDLDGGINNSFSFKDLLSDPAAPTRPFNLSEITSDNQEAVAIRNAQYKLIASADGQQEFYDLLTDPFELDNLIPGGLTTEQAAMLAELEAEALAQTTDWSCNDGILNGNEQPGDCSLSTSITDPTLPETFSAAQNFPNPFQQSTEIHYTVPADATSVVLEVFDLTGRRVRTLVDGSQTAGLQTATWRGQDANGHPVPSGVYIYRLTAGAFTQTHKMVMVK